MVPFLTTIQQKIFLLSCILAVRLFAVSSSAEEMKQDKSTGQAEYEISCMGCHGLDGKGDGPQAKTLSVMPPDLTRLAQNRKGQFPEREIYDLIDGRGIIQAHKKKDMPVWGLRYRTQDPKKADPLQNDKRARQQIENLVTYLKKIQQE